MIKSAIANPYATLVGVIILLIFGSIAMGQIPVQLKPAIEPPEVSVQTFYFGASPIEIECEFVCSPNGTNIWTVTNAGKSFGVITLEQATYNSVNAVYAQVSNEVGPANIVDVAKRMGVTESSLNPVLSIVLGTSEVTTIEMASAYVLAKR